MPLPFAINGLGRIGRALVRIASQRAELELVAANDLATAPTLAHLLKYDTVHGRFPGQIGCDGQDLVIGGRRVTLFRQPDHGAVPWEQTTARVVVDATGTATRREVAAQHLRGGVGKVVISALAEDADATLCPGLNSETYDAANHHVISSASCTTHCLGLLLAVLHRRFGVRHALMNEVHSYTGNQQLVDTIHEDPRRARAAAVNIVPTTTAAPAAVERLLPDLAGRVRGCAVRVPTPNMALLDLVVTIDSPTDEATLRATFQDAAERQLSGFLAVSEEPLVSADYVSDSHSAIVDLPLTQVVAGELCRVMAWYDNEWGYTHRIADLLTLLSDGFVPAAACSTTHPQEVMR